MHMFRTSILAAALLVGAASPVLSGDLYLGMSPSLDSPYIGGFAVTKSDTTVFTQPTRAIYVGGVGDLAVTYLDGSSDILKAVPAGTLLRIRVTQVKSTSTTATNISALY